jgi:pyruvate dehydrogenase E1 component alpha subunit
MTTRKAHADVAQARPARGDVPLARAEELGILRVLDRDGVPNGQLEDPRLDDAILRQIYETMTMVRAIDERGWTLQRSGRVEFWIPARGLEAVHVASTAAMSQSDWIFIGYRHPGSMLLRGASLIQLFAQFFGRYDEPLKGRRLPTLIGDRRLNIVPLMTQVGSWIPHACGAAWAAKIKGDDTRFLVYFGDGSTSRGEFHSAMNFAGIYRPPVVFMCENNGWAVTTPTTTQTAVSSFAEKGSAYGVRNLRVDGNDPLAVYAVTRKARNDVAEEGPILIEAVTYRTGFHTSSDNPDLYRTAEELKAWEAWDPITRLRRYMEHRGAWTDTEEDALRARCKSEIDAAVRAAEAMPLPPPGSMFDDIFAHPIWNLVEQRDALLEDLEWEAANAPVDRS